MSEISDSHEGEDHLDADEQNLEDSGELEDMPPEVLEELRQARERFEALPEEERATRMKKALGGMADAAKKRDNGGPSAHLGEEAS